MKKWPHEELEVWQLSMDLVDKVYQLTETFPKDERYGLTDQVKRSVVSVANNIAEGKGMYSQKSFLDFLYRARGSLYETATCLAIAERRKYITQVQQQESSDLAFKVQGKLAGLINYMSKLTGQK